MTTPQQPHQPPATGQPPAGWVPAGPDVDRKKDSRRQLIIAGVVIAAVLVIFAALWLGAPESKADQFEVQVTSCTATDTIAKVGFSVKNVSDEIRSATVKIEYRDGGGARLDTDTATLRDVRPGETVRRDESTLLDAAPGGSLECALVGIT